MRLWVWIALGALVVGTACVALSQGAAAVGVGAVMGSADAVRSGPEFEKCERLKSTPVPYEDEVQLGGAVAVNWVQKGGGLDLDMPPAGQDLRQWKLLCLPPTPKNKMNRYLNRVGKNLAAQSRRPMLDWTFGVLNSDGFNAFSAPGGYVLVTRGVLKAVKNEAQLAGILGHEISHVTFTHALNTYRGLKAEACKKAVADQIASTGAAIASQQATLGDQADVLGRFTDGVVEDITAHGFAEGDEFEADQEGTALMIGAGYNPYEYISFLSNIPDGKDFFPNHPSGKKRQEKLAAYLDLQKRLAASSDSFTPAVDYKNLPTVALTNELSAAK